MTTTKSTYRITANGHDYGTYEGADEDEALDAMIQDAGYESRKDLPEHIDPDGFEVTEV